MSKEIKVEVVALHAGTFSDGITLYCPRDLAEKIVPQVRSILRETPRLCGAVYGSVIVSKDGTAEYEDHFRHGARIIGNLEEVLRTMMDLAGHRVTFDRARSLLNYEPPSGWVFRLRRACCLRLVNRQTGVRVDVHRESMDSFQISIFPREKGYGAYLLVEDHFAALTAALNNAEMLARLRIGVTEYRAHFLQDLHGEHAVFSKRGHEVEDLLAIAAGR